MIITTAQNKTSLDLLWVCDRFVPYLVKSIGGVRDKLSQKDLFVAVEGVNDQAHQLVTVHLDPILADAVKRGRGSGVALPAQSARTALARVVHLHCTQHKLKSTHNTSYKLHITQATNCT